MLKALSLSISKPMNSGGFVPPGRLLPAGYQTVSFFLALRKVEQRLVHPTYDLHKEPFHCSTLITERLLRCPGFPRTATRLICSVKIRSFSTKLPCGRILIRSTLWIIRPPAAG